MPINEIVIKGAREHNLKNVDVTIPRDKLVVMTGLSGSGKSSLAFDTIYADGQRRYPYTRKLLPKIHVLLWVLSPRYTTISDCFTPV